MTLFFAPEDSPAFRTFFQQGVHVEIKTGDSLENLLCCQWEIDRQYVMSRISTLFLNGKPVDDMAGSIVHDGATLALSGAMPGLIGATMRRGGILAPFRSGITYCAGDTAGGGGNGRITLKLFNLLIEELGPRFLDRGIWVARSRLAGAFPDRPELAALPEGDVHVRLPLSASPPIEKTP